MKQALRERVARVRAFNRLYTGVIGVLDEGLVGSPYSLTESRVLYELEQEGVGEVTELRRRLGLDAGYASRLLAKLAERGLLTRQRSSEDGRRQVIRLTESGRAEQRKLEQRTIEQISALLDRLSEEDQGRLVAAMHVIGGLVGGTEPDSALVLRPPRPGDYGWVIQRHGELYSREYGWNFAFEALVARIVADYVDTHDPEREAAWIAELGGERVGCVFCVRGSTKDTAKLRLLIVEPSARGHGVGKRLVAECLAFASARGYTEMELWTQNELTAARHIYQNAGFELVDEERNTDYGPELISETWRRPL